MTPQATLGDFSLEPGLDLDRLTDAEREAWKAVEQGDRGMREYARDTGRSAGTVGNLLVRARSKVGDDGGE